MVHDHLSYFRMMFLEGKTKKYPPKKLKALLISLSLPPTKYRVALKCSKDGAVLKIITRDLSLWPKRLIFLFLFVFFIFDKRDASIQNFIGANSCFIVC